MSNILEIRVDERVMRTARTRHDKGSLAPRIGIALRAAAALLSALATATPAWTQSGFVQWTSIGPKGALIKCLAIDPVAPPTLYAGTEGGVLKSTDGGATWRTANVGLANLWVLSLLIDQTVPSTIYAGTGGGVFKSTNGGTFWTSANPGLAQWTIADLAMSPTDPLTLYAATISRTNRPSGVIGEVHKSSNGGGSWYPSKKGFPNEPAHSLAVSRSAPSTIYAGMLAGGVFRSTDGGASWEAAGPGLGNGGTIETLAIDPGTASTLYISCSNTQVGVMKSIDGGTSWNLAGKGKGLPNTLVMTLIIDSTVPSTIYAGTLGYGVFRSIDRGGSWSAINTDSSKFAVVYSLVFHPKDPSILYAGTADGVFRIDRPNRAIPRTAPPGNLRLQW